MSVACWLVLLLPGLLVAQSEEEAQLATEAQALSPQIEAIMSGGFWSHGGDDGSFRLIVGSVGWEEVASRVFLQWIRLDHDKQEPVIVRTIPIKEIAGRWRVASQDFVLRDRQWNIIISAERRVPPAKATFTIMPTADFSYTVVKSEE